MSEYAPLMLVVTTESLPGYEVREVLGEVMGTTVRTHNPFHEGMRSLRGHNNPRAFQQLVQWREEAIGRMVEAAMRRGANAIIGMRFDHREVAPNWAEICAYGTAVIVSRQQRSATRRVPVRESARRRT